MVKDKEVRFIRVPGPAIIEKEIKNLENTVRRFERIIKEIRIIKKDKKDVRVRIIKRVDKISSDLMKGKELMPSVRSQTISRVRHVTVKKPIAKRVSPLPAPVAKLQKKSNMSKLRKDLESLQKDLK